jgi:hypothetical protein
VAMSRSVNIKRAALLSYMWMRMDGNDTRVWITMCLLADGRGEVFAELSGVATLAGLSESEVEGTLRMLANEMGGDPAVEEMHGGWRLLPGAFVMGTSQASDRNRKSRERKAAVGL